MHSLLAPLNALPEVGEILSRLRGGGCPVALGGLSGVHKAHLAAFLHAELNRPVLVVCPDELEAARVRADIAALGAEGAMLLRDRDFTFYPVETVSREWEQARIPVLRACMTLPCPVTVAAVDAVIQRAIPPGVLREVSLALRPNMEISPEKLTQVLLSGGYRRSEIVEGVGQFARRGGIMDIFPPGEASPVRVEFFGDEIDTLSHIDLSTQRRSDALELAEILPCMETLAHTAPGGLEALAAAIPRAEDAERLREQGHLATIDRYMALISPETHTFLDYLPRRAVVLLSEQTRLRERLKNLLWQRAQDIESLLEQDILSPALLGDNGDFMGTDEEGLWRALERYDVIHLDTFLAPNYPLRPHALLNVTAKQLPSYGASLDTAAGDIRHYLDGESAVWVLTPTAHRAAVLEEMLRERGIAVSRAQADRGDPPVSGTAVIGVGALSAGMEYPALRLAVLTEGQAAAPRRAAQGKSTVPRSNRKRLASYTDLAPGDLVVHEHHGIGRFAGITQMTVDGIKRDYIQLRYAGTDSLYVPVTQLHLVSKYIGQHAEEGEGRGPKLNKLGGAEWQRSKSRAKAAAKELAQGLIALYAERKRLTGHAFSPDGDWQMAFEEQFEYTETDDQLRCADEIKRDMESEWPMDRLLCGDVGFGKTEVALRAVMKCILDGKQAALLVPTTVLAQQHFVTAVRRFAGYPVRVDVLSRFRTPAQVKNTLKLLRAGQIDLVIGTHRILQKDVQFKNLGLLIVDEEQRFGVSHKERLKEIARRIDVLTLTATPIPRTLNMALSGIRDMSVLEEAPRDRYPVQTFVLEHDYGFLADAIRREVSRGGQVYYLHNRVETIDRAAARLGQLLEGVSVGVAHGQMKEDELAEIMRATGEGEISVLVCTTIIETGIDIPNVNTLIIEDADALGLAQLHQIRGRVGRSNRHAYAYLTYRRGKVLSEVATRRLSAVREFAEFGSGFKLAMRDMEIRGAGNVLGAEQSGHMISVGYDMYLKLLEEAVIEEQGGKPVMPECSADLPVEAGIGSGYISHAGLRMDYYRRIAAVTEEEEARDMRDELIDRFGDLPAGVENLIRIARLRAEAAALGVTDISFKNARLLLKLQNPDFAKISMLCAVPEYRGRVLFSAGDTPGLTIKTLPGQGALDAAWAAVTAMGKL
ncbi:MAG: transcription-repair coupling factor [Oscillospiraceae bacterium]|jgi:transcription-repair coupling factor (superfamily II helicase)|nr:transcription-repair coupling factor [Oscillospiraceae bacterium]